MPNLLVFDCTDQNLSVALQIGSQVISQRSVSPRQHAQRLLPEIEALLAEAELSLNNLDVIGFTNGPGSFTGLRIAVSAAQGLSYGCGCPLIALSSLQALAWQATHLGAQLPVDQPVTVLSMLDARMGELYCAEFQLLNGQIERRKADQLLPVSNWPEYYSELMSADAKSLDAMVSKTRASNTLTSNIATQHPVIALGPGAGLLSLPEQWLVDSNMQVDAVNLLPWLQAQFNAGLTSTPESVQPVYLRGAGAWKKMSASASVNNPTEVKI